MVYLKWPVTRQIQKRSIYPPDVHAFYNKQFRDIFNVNVSENTSNVWYGDAFRALLQVEPY